MTDGTWSKWEDLTSDPVFYLENLDTFRFNYRVKPEPKYRPYNSSEEYLKAIKDAGYPQLFINCAYYEDNKLHHTEDPYNNCRTIIAYAPTYIEVWLWLWREKKECIDILSACNNDVLVYINNELKGFNDPEEAIITAIEHLVDNDYIK